MKARIKATGEVLNIIKVLGFEVLLSNGSIYDYNKVEYITEPDWQQVRIQASIAIVQGWASTPQGLTKVCMAGAVELADALVAELMKGGQDE